MKCGRVPVLSGKVAWIAAMVCLAFSAVAQETKTSQGSGRSPLPLAGLEDVKKEYPNLQDKPFGKGIFAHVRRVSGKTVGSKGEIDTWAANPYIAGTQLSYAWAELEPKEGEYRWDIIEKDMEPWARAGKKCWIEVSTANQRDKAGDRVTPAWIFERGVPKIRAANTGTYPVFWNQRYINLWGSFVRAFAKKFDGDPRIEFISTGGYSSGHEPNLSSRDNDTLMNQWKRAGFDGFTTSGVYLNKAIKPILTIYSDAFRKTPVAQTIHVKTDFDRAMNEFAARKKLILISNGLSWKLDARGRQEWRDRREKLGVKVGYAEWGPTGRETDPDKLQEKKERKRAAREGAQRGEAGKGKDRSTAMRLIDAYRAAVGDDSDPKLRPWSRLSYLPLGERVPEVETEEEWKSALQWAWEHLDG